MKADELLLHDAAGADVQMADLGIPHLAFGQADVPARGMQEGVRAGIPQAGEGGGLREADGVIVGVFAPAEAVQDHQHHRSDCHMCLFLLVRL